MILLTLDTSSVTASAGIVDTEADKVLSECFADVPLTHSQTVLPMTQSVLSQAGLSFDQIDCLAVCSGPGSFTGVRIGVAAAKGLGFETDMPTASVSTLQALAMNIDGIPLDAVVCAVMDARCRQVYTASFSCDSGTVTRLTPDEAMSIEDCKAALLSRGRKVIFVGDGAKLCYEACKDEMDCVAAPDPLMYVRPRGIALAAKQLAEEDKLMPASLLQPTYLRLPQAERELKAKQAFK
ncbi:MAG: tRNA (adenosine(37)-N6)-threonylcarbamoyltransferase complex dimerization subunit type 1 TsaB [Ruminococcaceae bacterium]|nr:tRNA (adenosine(37)-N6)-threonylcarbamoyltransferase complex dimerization subunit type 1 TsaB [Oscillospiraceae bacterium]